MSTYFSPYFSIGKAFFFVFINTKYTNTATSGNSAPSNIPVFMPSCSAVIASSTANSAAAAFCETASVTIPTSCGATEAPKSPPAAIMA